MEELLVFRIARRVLRLFCPPVLFEEIEGDLSQRFQRDLVKMSRWRAGLRLLWSTLKFFRPGILTRNRFTVYLIKAPMLAHFIKIFARTSARDRLYTTINISGLTVGLTACIFIGLWVYDEVTFDTQHEDRSRIYEVFGNHDFPNGIQTMADTPAPLSPAIADLPQVEAACRMLTPNQQLLFKSTGQSFYEAGVFGDPSITDLFTFRWVEGGPLHALKNNNSIVISEKMAAKYFDDKALGQTLFLQGNDDVTVTGVFANMPANSTVKFDFVLPYSIYSNKDPYRDEWGSWSGGATFVKLRSNSDLDQVTRLIHERFTKPNVWVRWDDNVEFFLHPMTDWRLRSSFVNGIPSGGRIVQVKGLMLVAFFILLMACANFTNLSTARAVRRAKEVGVRKVIGARRSGLVWQFMTESFVLSLTAAALSLTTAWLLLPVFNSLTSKHVEFNHLYGWLALGLTCLVAATTLFAGVYPSVFLSSMKTASMMKGSAALGGGSLRKSLIVFQFTLSLVFIIGSVVVFQQLEFMRKKDLGFDRDNVFFFLHRESFLKHYEAFRNEAREKNAIINVVRSTANPMQVYGGIVLADDGWPGKTAADNTVFLVLRGDADFLPAMGFEMVAGRGFDGSPADSSSYIINQAAARIMHLENPVGAWLKAPFHGTIIGVIKDFHSNPLREKLQPVIISTRFEEQGLIFVKYEPGRMPEALAATEEVFREFEPDLPLEFKFMDDTFAAQYGDEILMGKLANICTGIAIFISCLGLLGLISFAAERRKKEIGIRKVLGADVTGIVSLLCGDTALLLLVACAIGVPLALWGGNEFLGRFEFHTSVSYGLVTLVVSGLLLLALAIMSFQSAKASLANPVDTLRIE